MAVESHGLPLGITLSGANTHDWKRPCNRLLPHTLKGRRYVLIRGMWGHKKLPKGWDMKRTSDLPGEQKWEKEQNPDFKAWRWVVEVCHSWLKRFRKLLVRKIGTIGR
jgi:alpha-L-fucosidase